MFCRNCGKEINDEAVICIHCGVPVKARVQEQKSGSKLDGLGLAGMILGIVGAIGGNFMFCMFSLIGLILSCVAFTQDKKDGKSSGYSIAGVVVGSVGLAVWLAIWIAAILT